MPESTSRKVDVRKLNAALELLGLPSSYGDAHLVEVHIENGFITATYREILGVHRNRGE